MDEKKTKKTKKTTKEKKEKKEKGTKKSSGQRRKRRIDLISDQKGGDKKVMLLDGCSSNVKEHFTWSEADLLGTGAFAKVSFFFESSFSLSLSLLSSFPSPPFALSVFLSFFNEFFLS